VACGRCLRDRYIRLTRSGRESSLPLSSHQYVVVSRLCGYVTLCRLAQGPTWGTPFCSATGHRSNRDSEASAVGESALASGPCAREPRPGASRPRPWGRSGNLAPGGPVCFHVDLDAGTNGVLHSPMFRAFANPASEIRLIFILDLPAFPRHLCLPPECSPTSP
jgi:hypothetical protein